MSEGDFAKQEVAEGVHAVEFFHFKGVDDVAEGFRHFFAFDGPPAVREYADGRRESERHEHRGPYHAVEADDVLADEVARRGPVFFPFFARLGEAEGRDVVDERVEPDVDDVLFVAGERDAPLERRARDGLIAQAALYEADDFVVAFLRHYRVGVLFVEFEKRLGVFREAEKVGLLRHLRERPVAVGAGLPFGHLRLGYVGLAGDAVPALVFAFVYVARGHEAAEYFLHYLLMARLRGADEVVVLDVERFPEAFEVLHYFVAELYRRYAFLLGDGLYLLPVLVRSRKEIAVVAAGFMPAAQDVRRYRRVGVAYVGHVVDVVYRRRDVKWFS